MTTATTLVSGMTWRGLPWSRVRAQAESTSKRSPSKSGRAACAAGSPRQHRKARTLGPLGMITSSVCKQPTKGRSSSRRPSRTGRMTSFSMRASISALTSKEGAKAPIPSVMVPRSWCSDRLWSCTAAGKTVWHMPSVKVSTETSAPRGHSSRAASSCGGSTICTPCFCAKERENALDESISAAACDGPKTGTPAPRNTSANPLVSICSEPTTARVMARSLQKSRTSLKSGGASGTSTGIRGAVSGLQPWWCSGWPLLKVC
mmetsp:Transcript_45983/g.137425  ORF Transcript_45983/g.137425 Transcript_45983/m.137425 type:complete len:261 (+) Transcript_45983:2193-2975(+)